MKITSPIHTPKAASKAKPSPAPQTPKQPCPKPEDSFLAKSVGVLADGARHGLNEVVLASKNDPALAMRMAATTLSDQILKKVDSPVKAGFNKTIVPVMRFALLGGNVIRAHNTFSNPVSSKLDRGMDAAVVASDLVGAVGGIAMLTSSRFAGTGEMLMGFSYAVDAVSHAIRGLQHAGERAQVWMGPNSPAKKPD